MSTRATWRKREFSLPIAFLLGLLLGGPVTPASVNPNAPGELLGFAEEDLKLLVDEGRRQIDAQSSRFENVQGRAQTLLTVSLVVLAFSAGGVSRLSDLDGWRFGTSLVLCIVALGLVLGGVALAAAVAVVRAAFDSVDTTQLSTYRPPILTRVAEDYALAVVVGETTVAARVAIFRQATRLTCWGAILAACEYVLTSRI